MKKSVVAFLAGFLLAIGVSVAHAEIESYIGRKVDGQFPLIVNGEISEVPAITIGGRSFIPLRAAGELFGARVSWIDGEVVMEATQQSSEKKQTSITPEEYAEMARLEQEKFDRQAQQLNEELLQKSNLRGNLMSVNFEIDRLKDQIEIKRNDIESREENLNQMPEYVISNGERVPYEGSDLQRQHQEMLAQLRQELADLEAQLAELEQQKAELEQQLETP
jgi:peptidoglycan hydrolase CwlO-like protein